MTKNETRKAYTKPEIQKWGSVTDLTQGGPHGGPGGSAPKPSTGICIPKKWGEK